MENKGAPLGNLETLKDTNMRILGFNVCQLAFYDTSRFENVDWSEHKCQYLNDCEDLGKSIHKTVK